MAAANGFDPLRASTWARWDSGLYLSIARRGYDLFPCAPKLIGGHLATHRWCGNAGWFPAYSWLTGGLYRLGLPLERAAVTISWLFALGTLVLLWVTFLGRRLGVPAIGCLVFAAFVPGQIYDYAVFPMSMLAFFTVLHLWLLDRRRWLPAGLAGAVAAMTYPIGVMLAPVGALWIVLVLRDAGWLERLKRTALTSGVTAAGFGVVLIDMKLETGSWNAYFKVQDKYGHGWHDPLSIFWSWIHPALHGSFLRLSSVPAVQTVFLGLLVGCLAVALALGWRELTALDGLLVLWAAFFFLFPLTQAGLSLIRSQAALLPLSLLLPRLPRPLMVLVLCAAVALSVPIAKLYLTGALV
ncbi:MAG: hypothetical protein M3076_18120 [Actinomycetota bacterium]|nr:hypothetical protein [Actinomycetota bacterium]